MTDFQYSKRGSMFWNSKVSLWTYSQLWFHSDQSFLSLWFTHWRSETVISTWHSWFSVCGNTKNFSFFFFLRKCWQTGALLCRWNKTTTNWVKNDSVQFSHSVVSDCLRPHELQYARPPCPSPTPGVHSDSHPSSQWCHPAISSSVVPFSSCPQSLPASVFSNESTPLMRQPSTGGSALASFLPKNTQDWSPLGWTGWISLQSKGLSRVFSNTTVQKYQFFSTQLSSQSNSHIHTWPQDKP